MTDWKDNSATFLKGIELARKEKSLREEADACGREAKKCLDSARRERLSFLKNEMEKPLKEHSVLIKALAEKKQEKEEVLRKGCEALGHVYDIINEEIVASTGEHTFFGTKYRTAGTKRCVVCGVWTTFHGFCTGCITTHSTPEVSEEHEELISKIDAEFDPQIATIEEKIFQKEDDIEKIEGELEELCNLFGHDAEIIDSSNEIFQCHCCNKKLSYREYIDAHWKATYKNVVPYYYSGE